MWVGRYTFAVGDGVSLRNTKHMKAMNKLHNVEPLNVGTRAALKLWEKK